MDKVFIGLGFFILVVVISIAMFNFQKKDFKNISEYPDTWAVTQAESEGKPVFINYRDGLKTAVGHAQYPYQIGVAVPLLNPTPDGLPTDEEASALWKIEDALVIALGENGEAVEALTITTNGMREFVFYTSKSDPAYSEAKIKSINVQPHQLQFMMQKDPNWNTFRRFVP